MDGIFLLTILVLTIFVIRVRLKAHQHYKKVKLLPIIVIAFYMILKGMVSESVLTFEWIAMGLLFGALGDYCLLYKEKKAYLAGGLVFFLVGHIFYAVAFFENTAFTLPWYYSAPLFVTALLYFMALVRRMLDPNNQHGRRYLIAPVGLYFLTIIIMVVLAANFSYSGNAHTKLAFAGALLFAGSDAILGFNIFVSYSALKQALLLFTYYTAQAFIVLSSFAS